MSADARLGRTGSAGLAPGSRNPAPAGALGRSALSPRNVAEDIFERPLDVDVHTMSAKSLFGAQTLRLRRFCQAIQPRHARPIPRLPTRPPPGPTSETRRVGKE